MKKLSYLFALFLLLIVAQSCSEKEEVVEIKTEHGSIYLWLYKDTPKHRANFIKLTKEGFYDGTNFHRIIKNFMIQGGDPYSKDSLQKHLSGTGGPGYTIDAEIVETHFHKKGALAAARQGDYVNPTRKSSGSQFYIVQGKKANKGELNNIEKMIQQKAKLPEFSYPEDVKNGYMENGGTPFLDMQYTVFGEVISGLDVIDKIAVVKTGAKDVPLKELTMDVNIIEMSQKELIKKFKIDEKAFKAAVINAEAKK